MADGADPNLSLRISGDASGAVAAADQTTAKLTQVVRATTQTVAAEQEATTAAHTLTAAQHEAAAVAQLYQTNLATAERALAILGATTGDAMENIVALDAAMDQAQAEAVKAAASTAAYNLEMTKSAAAAIAAAEAEEKQAAMSEVLAAALVRVGISEADVAAMATKMSISLEVAGRAMIQIKQAALADEVTAARVAIEALNAPTVAVAQAQEDLGEAAVVAGAKTTNSFGRGSPAFHAMVAASNISRGGAIAMRGWMEVAELVGVAFGGIVGPVILVSAVLGELIARYEEHKNKGKESAGEVKDAFDKMATAFGHFQDEVNTFDLKVITDQLREYLQIQREIKALQDAQDEAAVARIKDDLDRVDAQKKLALAKLAAQKEEAMAGAGDDPVKKAQIEGEYAEEEAQVKRQYIKDKTDFQLSENEREQEANRNQQAALVMNAEDAQKQIAAAQAKARSSAADAADAGYEAGPDGSFGDAKKLAEARLKAAGEANNAAQKAANDAAANDGFWHTSRSKTDADLAQEKADDAYQKFIEARKAVLLVGQAETDRAAAEDTAKQLEATVNNSVALDKLTSALKSLGEKHDAVITNAQTEGLEIGTAARSSITTAQKAAYDAKARQFLEGNETDGRGAKFEVRAERKTESKDDHELHEAVTMATQQFRAISGKSAIAAFQKMAAGLDEAQRGSLLLADLAQATDAKTRAIVQRLSAAENAIHALKTHF